MSQETRRKGTNIRTIVVPAITKKRVMPTNLQMLHGETIAFLSLTSALKIKPGHRLKGVAAGDQAPPGSSGKGEASWNGNLGSRPCPRNFTGSKLAGREPVFLKDTGEGFRILVSEIPRNLFDGCAAFFKLGLGVFHFDLQAIFVKPASDMFFKRAAYVFWAEAHLVSDVIKTDFTIVVAFNKEFSALHLAGVRQMGKTPSAARFKDPGDGLLEDRDGKRFFDKVIRVTSEGFNRGFF